MIKIVLSTNRAEVQALLSPSAVRDRATEKAAARIIAAVRAEGDAAVRRYARSLDGWSGPIEVSRRDIEAGARKAPAAVRAALRTAARAIRVVADAQRGSRWRSA
jgi:sulfopropanediol 3-dehydrogenase